MSIRFKNHGALRLFIEVAAHGSFTRAAEVLHMTKGAISYQITTLEKQLGFDLFTREPRGVSPTEKGQRLLDVASRHFLDLESEIERISGDKSESLTIGVSTYFAARWLSPRLMIFMQAHPDIKLRIQPMTQLFGLLQQGVDIAIRWGKGDWDDAQIIPFMVMPAWPAGNSVALKRVKQVGLERAVQELRLLRDHDDSNAWSDWFLSMGFEQSAREDSLIIPDPNVRVQAVIDGQGLALMDDLVLHELTQDKLFRLSEVTLPTYGYFFAIPRGDTHKKSIEAFVSWLQNMTT